MADRELGLSRPAQDRRLPKGRDLSGAGMVPSGDRECPANVGLGGGGFLSRHAVVATAWQRPADHGEEPRIGIELDARQFR
ncbi:hypothetical protein [Streptomyces sp. NPDC048200]|uniref:hypothetical protein n=1 Tax=Streptomyces sp. NPDC048200 TaxID=3365512 RepID=UPI00371C1461